MILAQFEISVQVTEENWKLIKIQNLFEPDSTIDEIRTWAMLKSTGNVCPNEIQLTFPENTKYVGFSEWLKENEWEECTRAQRNLSKKELYHIFNQTK